MRVTVCMPERPKVRVYVPGGSAGRRYSPPALDTVSRALGSTLDVA